MYKKMIAFIAVWTLALIMLGAYVRLSDAGLGCPDWPGCYGHITPHHAQDYIHKAQSVNPDGDVTMGKAWKEMLHRYAATFLGMMIIALVVIAWLRKQPKALPLALLAVVVVQGIFGALTVTMDTMPLIVTLHLFGGLACFSLALLILFQQYPRMVWANNATQQRLRTWAMASFFMVLLQLFLGGWVSTNYAALACLDFPTCQGSLLGGDKNFSEAFALWTPMHIDELGDAISPLSYAAKTAIHITHRLGALLVLVVVHIFAIKLIKQGGRAKTLGYSLLVVLFAQILLGISNIVFKLPLPVAVAHNGGAAILLGLLLWALYQLRPAKRAR